MMHIQTIVLLGLATSGLAQICCTPPQWEATKVTIAVAKSSQTKVTKEVISYDADNNRTCVFENVTAFGVEERFQVITDYQTMKMYDIDLTNKKCIVKALPSVDQFRKVCVYDTDNVLDEGYIGVGSNVLDTKTYQRNFGLGNQEWFTVTEDCVRVSASSIYQVFGKKKFSTSLWSDTTSGIADTSIFTPPDYCADFTRLLRMMVH